MANMVKPRRDQFTAQVTNDLLKDLGAIGPAGETIHAEIVALAPNTGVDVGDVDVTSVVPGVAATNLGKAEDAQHTSGDVGVAMLAVRKDAIGTLAAHDNDYAPLLVDANGRLYAIGVVASGGIASGAVASGAIVDGADVAEGATADVVVAAGAAGTVSAKLRRLTTDLDALLTELKVKADPTETQTVGGTTVTIVVTPTLTVGATYVANDFVGTNNTAMTFAGAARIAAGSGMVVGATLIDYALASVAAELWLFSAAPAGLGLDSAAFTITDADALLCIGVIPFASYYASALNSISNGSIPNGCLPYKLAAGTSLFGALVTRGAPAYTNGLVSVRICVVQD